MTPNKKIKMFKNGEWVEWDGSDVSELIIEETMTASQLKKHFPEKWDEYVKRTNDI